MAERTTHTESIVLGTELITGKKSDVHGRLSEPVAKIDLIKKNITISPEGDVGKIVFLANIKYQEATEKEDVPNFSLEIFEGDKLLGKENWRAPEDTFVKYDEYATSISVTVDLEKLRGKTISLRANLRCWLEESSWTPKGGGEETVSAEDKVNLSLIIPIIKDPGPNPLIVSFSVVGRGLYEDEEPKNYEQQNIGKEYNPIVSVMNYTNNLIKYGDFTIYEDNTAVLNFGLGKDKVKPGGSTDIIQYFCKVWTWYTTRSDGKLSVSDKADRKFIYELHYCLLDEYGWEYGGTVDSPKKKLTIVVSVPEYKLAALDVYNDSFDVEDASGWVELAGAAATCAAAGMAMGSVVAPGVGTALGGIIGFLAGFISAALFYKISSESIEKAARELRVEMKKLVDDPPTFDKNYKKLIVIKPKKVKLPKPKNKHEKIIFEIANLNTSIVANSKAMRKTASRIWTAKLKKDKVILKKQTKAFRKYQATLRRNLKSLADRYVKIAAEFKKAKCEIKRKDAIVLRDKIATEGLPKEVKKELRKKGFSRKRINILENRLKTLDLRNLKPAETYLRFSRDLLNLRKALKNAEL